MIENEELTKFMEQRMPQIRQQFWDDNNISIPGNMEDVCSKCAQKFKEIFLVLSELLSDRQCQLGEITISLIRQSAWEEKKRAVIEAYDSFEINKKLLYSDEIDIGWLFVNWEKYRKGITDAVKEDGLMMAIKEPHIIWMMNKSLSDMAAVMWSALKSVLLDADELDNYDKLNVMEGFRITAGEYQDWQELIYLIPPTLPIEEDNELPLMYQRVENRSFAGITFLNKDLTAAKFIKCSFIRCVFDNVTLKDARFVDCELKDVQIKNGSIESTGFIQSSLVNLDTRTSKDEGAYEKDCVIENVVMEE